MYPIRIKEFRIVAANELKQNPNNWRKHPHYQVKALKGLLEEFGIVDAALAYEDKDGSLILIDGHMRKYLCCEQQLPVLILDLDDKDADKVLATLDPLGSLAATDHEKLKDLIQSIGDESQEFLSKLSTMPNLANYFKDQDVSPVLGPLEYRIIINCESENQQIELLNEFDQRKLTCKPLIS